MESVKKQEKNCKASTDSQEETTETEESAGAPKAAEEPAQAMNPTMGILLFAVFCFLRASCYLCTDLLYRNQPELSPWQMFFSRSCMGMIIMAIHQNRNLKKEVFDSIEWRKSFPLGFKTLAGVATNLIQFSVTKFIPATIISIVANTAPIMVLIMAFFILKENVRKYDVLMIALTLIGIFTIILGADNSNSEKPEPSFPMWVLYILLFIYPCLSAGGIIAMRKMPKFRDAVVSWYLQVGTLITATIMIFVLSEGFAIFAVFSFWDWALVFGTGFTSVYSETVRFKALQLHQASSLQKLMPLITLFQWAFDISILGIGYTWIQDLGLIYLGVVYLIQGLKHARDSRKNKVQQKEQLQLPETKSEKL